MRLPKGRRSLLILQLYTATGFPVAGRNLLKGERMVMKRATYRRNLMQSVGVFTVLLLGLAPLRSAADNPSTPASQHQAQESSSSSKGKMGDHSKMGQMGSGTSMMNAQGNQGQMVGQSGGCCGPGMAGMMGSEGMHGPMIAFSILGGVLLASISAAFIALAIFLLRRSRTWRTPT
jgi:hypothetical protein